jgi:hypothetical protein
MQPSNHLTPPAIPHAIRVILMTEAALMSTGLMHQLTTDVATLAALIIMTDFFHIYEI